MKANFVILLIVALASLGAASLPATAQAGQNAAPPPPVPYATANQVNNLMSQLESTATSTASDLSRLRINKWKAPGAVKQQGEGNRQSILRNLETALPGMISAVPTATPPPAIARRPSLAPMSPSSSRSMPPNPSASGPPCAARSTVRANW